MFKVSVLIPCLNEEDNIKMCVDRIPDMPWSHEIIVIDDGSTDGTTQAARSIKRENLKVVGYRKNRGKGFAVRHGIEHMSGEIAVIQDADMATPPEELIDILSPIIRGEADFVNGSRMVHSQEMFAMKGLHVLGNRVFALIVSAMIRKRLTDTLCGFKAFRVDPLRGKLKESTWPDFELLIKARRSGMRISEIPIHYRKRSFGRSKMKTFKHTFDLSKTLVSSVLR